MAKFEVSSNTFVLPTEAEVHMSDDELDAAQDMYMSSYEEMKDDPVSYKNQGELSGEAEEKIAAFKNKKIGKSVFEYFTNRLAA